MRAPLTLLPPSQEHSNYNYSRKVYSLMLLAVASLSAVLVISPWFINTRTLAGNAVVKDKEPQAMLSEHISVRAAGTGSPWIRLADGRDIITSYSGQQRVVESLEQNQAEPLSLASADFDEDGVPDLISGYASAEGGIITLMRGNVDSIYPNAPEAQQRRSDGTFTDSPFLGPAFVFSLPEAADFIGAGDFDGDGHWDVVAAARGSSKLHLLSGNGKGSLRETREFQLSGNVTAMVTGEINRQDGLDDVVVGVTEASEAKALVFEGPRGALNSEPETLALPAEANALALGQLDNSYKEDLAIAAGNELVVVYGRDRRLSLYHQEEVEPPVIKSRRFRFRLRSLALGHFSGQDLSDIAILGDNGDLHLLSSGAKNRKDKVSRDLKKWKSKTIDRSNWSEMSKLVCTTTAGLLVDSLIVIDPATQKMQILAEDGNRSEQGGSTVTYTVRRGRVSARFEIEGSPIAVLPMRLNVDPLSDLVIMRSGRIEPTATLTIAQTGFVVTNTNDSGPGSLRQTISEAGANPGVDLITFSIGSGPQTITPLSPLPGVGDILDGTTQPGFAGKPIIEINGSSAGVNAHGLSGRGTIRGLVINRFGRDGMVEVRGIVEGNFIGTDISGTIALGNGRHGISASISSMLIGGTNPNARNVISGNLGSGIQFPDSSGVVKGNYIGTDYTGTIALGNLASGVSAFATSSAQVGGTEAGARNIISGNGTGVSILNEPGSRVQGNFIGIDVTGLQDLGNIGDGVSLDNWENTVGGTSPTAGNVISGNGGNGIRDREAVVPRNGLKTLIQGNLIGTDASGNLAMGNSLDGIFIADECRNDLIEGNKIAFNGGNGVNVVDNPEAATGIRILGNLIFQNSDLGINLGPPGVTPNDPGDVDGGANLQQNFPVLTSAISTSGNGATVGGSLNSTPSSIFMIEFFYSTSSCSSIGEQFGDVSPSYLGSIQVTTDSSGNINFQFPFTIPGSGSFGFINCTATDANGNTSELSKCMQIEIARTVILATNSASLQQNADVLSGNVVVNDVSQGPVLDSNVEFSIGNGVTIQSGLVVRADGIKVKQNATVASSIFYNSLSNNGTITGTLNSPLNLPVFSDLPTFKSGVPGSQNITVDQKGTITLVPGNYGDIVVKANGKVIFTGGTYKIRSIDARDKTQLLFMAPTEIRLAGKFDTDQQAFVGPNAGSGISASNIIFYVAGMNGNNGNLGASPKAAEIGNNNTIVANFYVPNGTLWLKQGTSATGAFIARDVDIGNGVKVALDSFFGRP